MSLGVCGFLGPPNFLLAGRHVLLPLLRASSSHLPRSWLPRRRCPLGQAWAGSGVAGEVRHAAPFRGPQRRYPASQTDLGGLAPAARVTARLPPPLCLCPPVALEGGESRAALRALQAAHSVAHRRQPRSGVVRRRGVCPTERSIPASLSGPRAGAGLAGGGGGRLTQATAAALPFCQGEELRCSCRLPACPPWPRLLRLPEPRARRCRRAAAEFAAGRPCCAKLPPGKWRHSRPARSLAGGDSSAREGGAGRAGAGARSVPFCPLAGGGAVEARASQPKSRQSWEGGWLRRGRLPGHGWRGSGPFPGGLGALRRPGGPGRGLGSGLRGPEATGAGRGGAELCCGGPSAAGTSAAALQEGATLRECMAGPERPSGSLPPPAWP